MCVCVCVCVRACVCVCVCVNIFCETITIYCFCGPWVLKIMLSAALIDQSKSNRQWNKRRTGNYFYFIFWSFGEEILIRRERSFNFSMPQQSKSTNYRCFRDNTRNNTTQFHTDLLLFICGGPSHPSSFKLFWGPYFRLRTARFIELRKKVCIIASLIL